MPFREMERNINECTYFLQEKQRS